MLYLKTYKKPTKRTQIKKQQLKKVEINEHSLLVLESSARLSSEHIRRLRENFLNVPNLRLNQVLLLEGDLKLKHVLDLKKVSLNGEGV